MIHLALRVIPASKAVVRMTASCLMACIFFSLAGCERNKAIDDSHDAKIAGLQSEVSQLKARLLVLDGLQDKRLSEVDARLAKLEAIQKMPTSTKDSHTIPSEVVPTLKKAISDCVSQVHASAEGKAETYTNFFTGFDAFYNPANGRVQNNSQYVGGQPAVFMFNKCMTVQGFPLT